MKTNKKLYSVILTSTTLLLLLIIVSSTVEVATAQNVSPKITETRITTSGSAVSPAIYGDRIVYQGAYIYML